MNPIAADPGENKASRVPELPKSPGLLLSMCVQWCDFPTSPPGEIATARAQDLVANDLFLFFHLFLHWFQVHSEWLDSHVLTEGSFHFPRATMHSYQSTSGSTRGRTGRPVTIL